MKEFNHMEYAFMGAVAGVALGSFAVIFSDWMESKPTPVSVGEVTDLITQLSPFAESGFLSDTAVAIHFYKTKVCIDVDLAHGNGRLTINSDSFAAAKAKILAGVK